MESGKGHNERFGTQVGKRSTADLAMVAVSAISARERQARQVAQSRQRPPERGDPDLSLADVVEEAGPYQFGIVGPQRRHPAGSLQSVPLIGGLLRPEQGHLLRAKPLVDLVLFRGVQRTSEQNLEETFGEVQGPTDGGYRVFDLQSTQRVEVGRNSMRAAPISLPHDSQNP